MCNTGHFNVEVNIPDLESLSKSKRTIRPFVEEYLLKNGKKIYLLGEGRLINLTAAEGHPAIVMDLSFANQSLGAEYIVKNGKKLDNKVHPVPIDIDDKIAELKLKSMEVNIDILTAKQKEYLSSWKIGT